MSINPLVLCYESWSGDIYYLSETSTFEKLNNVLTCV